MMRILMLVLQGRRYELDNNLLIPQSLKQLGHTVMFGDVNTLQIINDTVVAKQAEFEEGHIGGPQVKMDKTASCEDFDLCWLLNNASPANTREFFQLLWVLEKRVRFVNKPSSLFFLNNKIGVLGLKAGRHFAPTNVVMNAEDTNRIISAADTSKWADMEKDGLQNLEEALQGMQEHNALAPHAPAYMDGLLDHIHRYRTGEEDPDTAMEQAAIDTVALLRFLDIRLGSLEKGGLPHEW